jgi:hypothetical protein
MRILPIIGLAFFGFTVPSSGDELKSSWCDFRAHIPGSFNAVIRDDQRGLLHAHQNSSDYLVSWLCERQKVKVLPNRATLCSEMQVLARSLGADLIECVFGRDPLDRFVQVIIFMKARNRTIIAALYISQASRFTMSLTNYGLNQDKLLEIFERVNLGIHFNGR